MNLALVGLVLMPLSTHSKVIEHNAFRRAAHKILHQFRVARMTQFILKPEGLAYPLPGPIGPGLLD